MTVEDTQLQRGRRTRLSMLRSRRGRTRLLVVVLVAAAAIGSGGWILAAMQGRTVEQTERADAAEVQAAVSAENARAIAEQIRDECERESEVAEQLGDLCRQAEEVVEEPAAPAVVAPTEEQLRPLVREFVDAWLAANPPRDGRDGRTPTVDEISDLIAAEYARNPPADGEDGEDGRNPTAAEIRPLVVEAVAAHLAANPPPPGEPGIDGEDGTDGQPGQDGVDGRDGEDGAPGEPPMSWTTTRCDVIGRCVTETCVRAEPFDPQAPTYTCSESAAPGP